MNSSSYGPPRGEGRASSAHAPPTWLQQLGSRWPWQLGPPCELACASLLAAMTYSGRRGCEPSIEFPRLAHGWLSVMPGCSQSGARLHATDLQQRPRPASVHTAREAATDQIRSRRRVGRRRRSPVRASPNVVQVGVDRGSRCPGGRDTRGERHAGTDTSRRAPPDRTFCPTPLPRTSTAERACGCDSTPTVSAWTWHEGRRQGHRGSCGHVPG